MVTDILLVGCCVGSLSQNTRTRKKSKQGNMGNRMCGIVLIQDTDNQTGAFQLEKRMPEGGHDRSL